VSPGPAILAGIVATHCVARRGKGAGQPAASSLSCSLGRSPFQPWRTLLWCWTVRGFRLAKAKCLCLKHFIPLDATLDLADTESKYKRKCGRKASAK